MTYTTPLGVTHASHMRHTRCHTDHESRSTILDSLVPRSLTEEFEEFFIRNFFAKIIYELLTHFLPRRQLDQPPSPDYES